MMGIVKLLNGDMIHGVGARSRAQDTVVHSMLVQRGRAVDFWSYFDVGIVLLQASSSVFIQSKDL